MNMNKIAFNHIPHINTEALTVKRKGKVIKGETEANIAAALKERQSMKNAAKRLRRMRQAGYTSFELIICIAAACGVAGAIAIIWTIVHFITKH